MEGHDTEGVRQKSWKQETSGLCLGARERADVADGVADTLIPHVQEQASDDLLSVLREQNSKNRGDLLGAIAAVQ